MSSATIRNFIIACLVLFIAAGAFGYILYMSISQQHTLNEALTAITKREAQEVAYVNAKRTAQESEEDRKLLDAMFIEEESDSIEFLTDVETSAKIVGINLQTNSLEVVEDKKTKAKALTVGFTFDGSRAAVEEFIEALEQLGFIAEIQSFSLAARSSTNWQAQVTVVVNLQDYAK